MSRYAVKIGEIQLRSDSPITAEQRDAAIEQLKNAGYRIVTKDGMAVITLAVDGDNLEAAHPKIR